MYAVPPSPEEDSYCLALLRGLALFAPLGGGGGGCAPCAKVHLASQTKQLGLALKTDLDSVRYGVHHGGFLMLCAVCVMCYILIPPAMLKMRYTYDTDDLKSEEKGTCLHTLC